MMVADEEGKRFEMTGFARSRNDTVGQSKQ